MGKQARLHREAAIAGTEKPFRQSNVDVLYLTCSKCHTTMTESLVEEHLKECQPAGATCGKCHKIFKPVEFLDHFKSCNGPEVEQLIVKRR